MSPDGKNKGILFGDLFNIYNSISNKVCKTHFSVELKSPFKVKRYT